MARIGRDVRVDGRLFAFEESVRPPLVVARGIERVAREVEVVFVEAGEVGRDRADLDEIGGVPRPPERNRRLVEERVDVDRLVRLAVPARLSLGYESYDRGVALGELGLVVERGARNLRTDDRDSSEQQEQRDTR